MLAAHSPVFAQLCHSAQLNTAPVPGKGISRISMRVECDPDAWSDIQTYLYTGRLNVRPEHAIEALSVCTYYQIEPLVRAYSLYSESFLKIDTVNVLLASALQFDLGDTVQRCEQFIQRNAAATMLNPTFEAVPGVLYACMCVRECVCTCVYTQTNIYTCTEHEVCRLLSMDALEIAEVDAFLAVVRWGKARCPNNVHAELRHTRKHT